ncbi:hypothetical protein CEXT_182371, partial [Caerostris extrusa]
LVGVKHRRASGEETAVSDFLSRSNVTVAHSQLPPAQVTEAPPPEFQRLINHASCRGSLS